MIHPATCVRVVDSIIGDGVFATEFIPKGTLVWVLCRFDRVIDRNELACWPERVRRAAERFGYIDPMGRLVVCWDHARLVNHSCDPSTIGVGNAFEIARRDILPGDQITCDYGLLNMTSSLVCRCGSAGCRGVVRAQDAGDLEESWDIWARDAFAAALTVKQPLLPYVRADNAGDDTILDALRRGFSLALPSSRMLLRAPVEAHSEAGHLWGSP
jgi:hypothetical protein